MPRTPAPDSPVSDSAPDSGRPSVASSVVTAVNNGATVRMNRSVSPGATTISSPRSVPHSTSMACLARMNACEQRWIRTSSPPEATPEASARRDRLSDSDGATATNDADDPSTMSSTSNRCRTTYPSASSLQTSASPRSGSPSTTRTGSVRIR